MMTEIQFRNHSNLRDELDKLLSNPTMKMALEIVADRAKPRSTPEPRPNAHLDTLIAQEYKHKQGVQWAIDTLNRLTKLPDIAEDAVNDEGEFDHSLPREIREALKNRA